MGWYGGPPCWVEDCCCGCASDDFGWEYDWDDCGCHGIPAGAQFVEFVFVFEAVVFLKEVGCSRVYNPEGCCVDAEDVDKSGSLRFLCKFLRRLSCADFSNFSAILLVFAVSMVNQPASRICCAVGLSVGTGFRTQLRNLISFSGTPFSSNLSQCCPSWWERSWYGSLQPS